MRKLDNLPPELVERIALQMRANGDHMCKIPLPYPITQFSGLCVDCPLIELAQDWGQLRLTCRSVNAMLFSLFGRHCFGTWRHRYRQGVGRLVGKLDHEIFRLSLEHLTIVTPPEDRDAMLPLLPLLPLLLEKVIDPDLLQHGYSSQLTSILRRLPKLKSLTLELAPEISLNHIVISAVAQSECSIETLECMFAGFQYLHWGTLEFCNLQHYQFSTLRKLKIGIDSHDAPSEKDGIDKLVRVFSQFPVLEDLTIWPYGECSVESLLQNSKFYFPKLAHLRLCQMDVSQEAMVDLIDRHRATLASIYFIWTPLKNGCWIDVIEELKEIPHLSDVYFRDCAQAGKQVMFVTPEESFCACDANFLDKSAARRTDDSFRFLTGVRSVFAHFQAEEQTEMRSRLSRLQHILLVDDSGPFLNWFPDSPLMDKLYCDRLSDPQMRTFPHSSYT